MSKKKILLIDMDETLCDFSGSPDLRAWQEKKRNPSAMFEVGFFRHLVPLPGAIAGVMELLSSNLYDIYVLSQPVAKSPHSYSEKVEWILTYLPDLRDKIILCQDKYMVKGDILIDDDKSRWGKFDGKFVHFNRDKHPFSQWQSIVESLLKDERRE